MNAKGMWFASLLALLGVAAGIVIGRQPLRHAAAPNSNPQPTAPGSNTASNSKPPETAKPKPRASAPRAAVDQSKIMTFEEAAAAIQAARTEGNQSARFRSLQKIANTAALADTPKVLTLANAITSRDLKASFVSILIGRWAESDPVAAITYAQGLTKVQEREQAIVSALEVWAKHDAAAALAWFQQLPQGGWRNQAAGNIVSAMAQENPRGARGH